MARESSPYLLLHAKNPVDWYPWGPEALERAKKENKPIFLSVGYSSCFWCHVMERQVFENAEIAAFMNQHFINIKVDREERPDLDDVYMLALQVYQQLAGSDQGGGWPLSLFLTPDGKPIAGGTYFPPKDLADRPGFPTVMKQIQSAWEARQSDVIATADLISKEVVRLSRPAADEQPVPLEFGLVIASAQGVAASYDPDFGGFDFSSEASDGPKFPNASRLELIQSRVGRQDANDQNYSVMIDHTLQAMAAGGLRDHLGGGFHRYSVDRAWKVPHFEKMLYDNAQLARIYVDAYRRTGREIYRQIAEQTLDFVLAEMTDARGGFYSALDAETDGVEGKYYVWSLSELKKQLPESDLRIFSAVYGIDDQPELEYGHVLSLVRPIEESAGQLGMPIAEMNARLAQIQQQLLKSRQQRPALLKDDKILTSWNGLMIQAFAQAGLVFKRRDYITAAENSALYILSTHRSPEGRLLRTSRHGVASLSAYLDDYAFLTSGLLSLREATGEDKWLTAARRLTDAQLSLFWDQERGGFYFTGHDQEAALARTKSAYDSALPSGNSVSVRNLVRLARLGSDESYRQAARKTLQAFAPQLKANPANLPHLAVALNEYLHWYGSQDETTAGGNLFTERPTRPESIAQSETEPVPPQAATEPVPPPTTQNDQPVVAIHAVKPEGHEHVAAQGYFSVDRLSAGETCRIAIQVEITDPWHVNANPPRPDYVIPTRIRLKETEGFELSDVVYPKGKDFQVEGFDEPLSVYEGTIFITGTLRVPENVTAPANITLQLDYQACDNQNCLRPMKLDLTAQLPVAAEAEQVISLNQALFKRLDGGQQ